MAINLNNKQLNLFDKNKIYDSNSVHKTKVILKNHATGETIWERCNKVILAGSEFTAAKHFNITPPARTPSYNSILGLDNTDSTVFTGAGIRREEQVFLFAVGTNGCGVEASQVYDVNYANWIAPEYLVPFRYQTLTNDLNDILRGKYFGRKTTATNIIYYFKSFETDVVMKKQYVDGTPIDSNIYLSTRLDEVETYVEIVLAITKDDCRDFFIGTTGINDALVNSISLLTAWPTTINNYTYYQDIRPLTEINYPNESLIDLTKGLDVIYQVYY